MSRPLKTPTTPTHPPIELEAGLKGYTIPQIAKSLGAHDSTVYTWCNGVTVSGVFLKLKVFIQADRPLVGRLVDTAEWTRFHAAYVEAKSAPFAAVGA